MENKFVTKLKDFIRKIDRAAGIQLIMICMTLAAFIALLFIQQYLPSFEGAQSKLIIVDVLLGVGLVIEFGYFFWHTNKYGKVDEVPEEKQSVEVATESIESEEVSEEVVEIEEE